MDFNVRMENTDRKKIPLTYISEQIARLMLLFNDMDSAFNMVNDYINENIKPIVDKMIANNKINSEISMEENNNYHNYILNKLDRFNIIRTLKPKTINIHKINKCDIYSVESLIRHVVKNFTKKLDRFHKKITTNIDYKNHRIAHINREIHIYWNNSKFNNSIFLELFLSNNIPLDKYGPYIFRYSNKNKKLILVPPSCMNKTEEKCGIDMGIRTFISCSDEKTKIGNNTRPIISKYITRMERIQYLKDTGKINSQKYNKIASRLDNKISNQVNDMHCKAASYLTSKYEVINIGNIKEADIIKSNVPEINKKIIQILKLDNFQNNLKAIGKKKGCEINVVDEYLTSKICSNCGSYNNVGSCKVYVCSNCKMILDRDFNAAKNIKNIEK